MDEIERMHGKINVDINIFGFSPSLSLSVHTVCMSALHIMTMTECIKLATDILYNTLIILKLTKIRQPKHNDLECINFFSVLTVREK